MNRFIFFITIISLPSCEQKKQSQLELHLYSKNNDTIQTIQSLFLTGIHSAQSGKRKTFSFENIKCSNPNKFIFDPVQNGSYTVLISIEKNNAIYNIVIDSITIKDGLNVIKKELNLGTAEL